MSEHLSDIDELHRAACFGAWPEILGIGGLPLFSATLHEHDVKHRRTRAARNPLSRIVFRMNSRQLSLCMICGPRAESFT